MHEDLEELSERAIYRQEAADARAALAAAAADLKANLARAVDVRPAVKDKVRRHPYAAVGVASAVGFAAAFLAAPSPQRKLKRRLRTLEDAIRGQTVAAKPRRRNRLLRIAFGLARGPIVGLLTSGLTAASAGASAGAAAGAAASAPKPATDGFGDVT